MDFKMHRAMLTSVYEHEPLLLHLASEQPTFPDAPIRSILWPCW